MERGYNFSYRLSAEEAAKLREISRLTERSGAQIIRRLLAEAEKVLQAELRAAKKRKASTELVAG